MCVCTGKKNNQYYPWFQASTKGLGTYSPWKKGANVLKAKASCFQGSQTLLGFK